MMNVAFKMMNVLFKIMNLGEGLLLRKFDANETGGWSANPYNDSTSDYHPYLLRSILIE